MKDLSIYRLQFRVYYSVKKSEEGFQSGSNFVCSGYDEPKRMSQNLYAQCHEDDFEEVFLDEKNKFLKIVSLRKDYKEVLDSKFYFKKLISKSAEIVEVDKAILFKKKPYYT